MANNNQTFELGFLDDFEDLENVSEMDAETSEASKDQQSESATSANNRIANLSERDLEKIPLKISICNRMGPNSFKVFTKLPESRSDEGYLENFENTSEINP